MVILHFRMQRKDSLIVLMARVMCLQFSMQEGDILEHTNRKCHLCTFSRRVAHCVT